jgi:myo-inositol 2-dehydrogenase/D-chiro-inositol 1-dehydrogenase
MARIGIGVIGAGRQGAVHARLISRSVPEARLVGVADVDPVAARRLADETGVGAFTDPAALMEHRDVRAIVIAVSSHRHLDVVRQAASAGHDILCEKPLALSLAETELAIEAAAAAGVRLQVGFMRRWDADYRRAKARLEAGELGRPTLFKSLQFDTDPVPPGFRDPAISGGIMVDMGIHEFDLAAWLLGQPVAEVHAFGTALIDQELGAMGDVDNAVIDLRMADGALGSVELTRNAAYGEDVRTEVLGSMGSVFVGLLPLSQGAFASAGRVAIDTMPGSIPRFRDALVEQTRGFVRAIIDDRPVEVGGEASRDALAVALAARRSLEEGRPVAVTEVGGAPVA